MPLETGDWIEDLVETNPPGTDNVSQGDDHLRLIKHVLMTQFNNLGPEAVTATAAELNSAGRSLMPLVTTYGTPAAAQTHTFGVDRTWYRVTVTGGGGGGALNDSGGSAAGTTIFTAPINEATAIFTVGAGGSEGQNGEDSTWVTNGASLVGGAGNAVGINVESGVGTGGDINIRGGGGPDEGGGRGGGSYWTGGHSNVLIDGSYGSGGRGFNAGGDPGGNGVIYIEEY